MVESSKTEKDKFIPIARPDLPDMGDIKEDIETILKSGMITNYEFVRRFEKKIAEFLNVKYAACVSSGTSALMLAAKALDLKGEVIVPSFTFSATAHALVWCGLKPIFVDAERDTFNIDIEKVKEAITPRTSAIVPVHVFGNPCKIDELEKLSKENNLKLLFDSAHAFGTSFNGKKVGGFGDAEIFSLTPTKVLTAAEGGVVTTNNRETYEQVVLDREYGKQPNYDCKTIGISARMGEFNAILGIHNLAKLDENIKRRKKLYDFYKSELEDVKGISFQKINSSAHCSIKDFAIIIDKNLFGIDRDELAEALTEEKIGWRKYFYPPLHRETAYGNMNNRGDALPNTNFISDNILNLPFFTALKTNDIVRICNVIKKLQH
ncbi:DegT/DnrJ/EryC1/StrS family aminotransferase [Candidatus Woesearchaeota archaeon]|jgi:dTDP-4-amino-4,6-dideoxygalactose transaminase|nr:DegT/DnrJ/EryC1/StrS family aminotransferase [Candidatus Woesearchaeota archaeon]MBT3538441.1 DegT/DnrJ/EryC1/StrS family aminotransferase [Candidatus Woesearchaeota archaeon]MBT4697004.1 DegT/DnrJ/EryC1/StrS family aminotransferase [Candidatus Woesearchaeota archaeon]MBT7106103.1 DegT/DnrJ/EryC1/StrS family aminotransferase [Candidatus Woesearchaeota archaeon]MBT7930999.1 DegT/DnrJ/EryC1/StrS family aminotransferase [Candidatus Woesearchaeota archaeon]